MTHTQILGAALLSLPLIGIFAAQVYIAGWWVTAAVWFFAIAATGIIVAGAFLLTGQWTP